MKPDSGEVESSARLLLCTQNSTKQEVICRDRKQVSCCLGTSGGWRKTQGKKQEVGTQTPLGVIAELVTFIPMTESQVCADAKS